MTERVELANKLLQQLPYMYLLPAWRRSLHVSGYNILLFLLH